MIKSQVVTTPQTNKETELIRLQNMNSLRILERGTPKEMQGHILQNPKPKTQGREKNDYTDHVRRNPKKTLKPQTKTHWALPHPIHDRS